MRKVALSSKQHIVSKDYSSCANRIEKGLNVYRRAIIKSSKFPIYFKPIEYTSPRNNKFLLFIEGKSKKDATTPFVTFVVYYFKPEGIYAIMVFPSRFNSKKIVIYPPHFFDRYKERYLEKDIATLDAMKEYFKFNSANILQFSEGKYYRGSCNHGFVFGEKLSENINIIKAFITKEMLKGDQNTLNTILNNELVELNNLKIQHKELMLNALLEKEAQPRT